ncbi:methyltransferase family protein [Flexithrix dorotheae]|uniref:methyltransferase family protein n=1 Tax=Flexithrix dorotheae TaxID=70993 RepID=UPI0003A66791|nr:methyltransferase [Flexithrix dorotheae]
MDFLVWPIPSEASTGALITASEQSNLLKKTGLVLVFSLNLLFYLAPLGIAVINIFGQDFQSIGMRQVTGLIISITGRYISLLGSYSLRKNSAESLKTSAIFKFSRNPISLGMHFTILGLVLFFNIWYLWIGFIFYLLNIHFKILIEEKFLAEKFGPDYIKYLNKTPRYL